MKKLFIFLAGIQFAIVLILTAAAIVIAGTFVESSADSHRYAEKIAYGSPFFRFLIGCFFINILFSSLRRWPFRKKHIPFLVTHLGLLMVLSGVMVKAYFGIQGSMSLYEGSASSMITLADTYAIQVENRMGETDLLPLDRDTLTAASKKFPGLTLELAAWHPHSLERFETWMQGNRLKAIHGKPFDWEVRALQSENVRESMKLEFLKCAQVIVKDPTSGKIVYEGPIVDSIDYQGREIKTELTLADPPSLKIHYDHETVKIPLCGDQSLLNLNESTPYRGVAVFEIDLILKPRLTFIQDFNHDIILAAFDPFGRVAIQEFPHDHLKNLIAYDDGFQGYAIQTDIPADLKSRSELESEAKNSLSSELNTYRGSLIPPLELLRTACERTKADFGKTSIAFLNLIDKKRCFTVEDDDLTPELKEVLSALDWSALPEDHLKAINWSGAILKGLDGDLKKFDLMEALEKRGWPLVKALKEARGKNGPCSPEEVAPLITLLLQQVFSISSQLPKGPNLDQAASLSAFFKAYGLSLQGIVSQTKLKRDEKTFAIEAPLSLVHRPLEKQRKLEDNRPLALVDFMENGKKERMALSYDPYSISLKMPVLQGSYLVRFQPNCKNIPYRIRLRDARQINYAGTGQPFSYECDLYITDLKTNEVIAKTISMNRVHETWDGFRFYLSGLTPSDETQVQRVNIVVNLDPAKYILTYPGAILVALGIVLLFFFRPYSSS